MATAFQYAVRPKLTAKPRKDLDVEKLRDEINQRYEPTLRYLGR
jgi:hypothetical protein